MQFNFHLPVIDRVLIWVFKQIIMISMKSSLFANVNHICSCPPTSAPPQVSGITFS